MGEPVVEVGQLWRRKNGVVYEVVKIESPNTAVRNPSPRK